MIAAGIASGILISKIIHDKKQWLLDHEYGLQAVTEFFEKPVTHISDEDLARAHEDDNVLMAKHPDTKFRDSVSNGAGPTESMKFFNPLNIRYWPYSHYTYPYQHTEGGAYSPGLYSRYYHWQPGYDTAGWSYWMRPGMSYRRWPRNRWVRNNGSYYFINNGHDRRRDFL